MLELHLVDAVGVGQHLADIEQLQRSIRAVLGVGHLQDALEVERHDGDAIQRRLPDLLPVDLRIHGLRRPPEPGGRERCDAGGGAEEFSSVHLTLLLSVDPSSLSCVAVLCGAARRRWRRPACSDRAGCAAAPRPPPRPPPALEIRTKYLPALGLVAHRHAAGAAAEGAGPQHLPGVLVVGPHLAVAAGVKDQSALGHDDAVPRADATRVRRAARGHRRRVVAVGDLPFDLAGVEVVGGQRRVRRLGERREHAVVGHVAGFRQRAFTSAGIRQVAGIAADAGIERARAKRGGGGGCGAPPLATTGPGGNSTGGPPPRPPPRPPRPPDALDSAR